MVLPCRTSRSVPSYWLLNGDGPRPAIAGVTAEWTDVELLIHAARQLPDIDFVLIGEVMRIHVSELAALPNVRMIGEVPVPRFASLLARVRCLPPAVSRVRVRACL